MFSREGMWRGLIREWIRLRRELSREGIRLRRELSRGRNEIKEGVE